MSKPTVQKLDEYLRDLVNWGRFALNLPGIDQTQIEIIEKNKRDDIVEQKLALYKTWLQVYPNASWNDVIHALEEVEENTIASDLRAKFPTAQTAMSPIRPEQPEVLEEVVRIEEVPVKEDVVKELDKLHTSFLSLAKDVKCEIESEVEQGNMTTKSLVRHTEELRAFEIKELQSVKTTDDFFQAILPHYNFLNCYLLVSLAMLLSSSIATRANEYSDKVKKFMKDTRVQCLQKTLKRYYQIAKTHGSNNVVSITLEHAWGDQSMWVGNMLVQTLFPAKHPDEHQWFDVVPGSTVVKFLTAQHVTTLIVNSRKKLQFMRLIGVIGLQVGSICVLKKKDENKLFTFENSLIQATIDDNIEAVQFLLEHVQVNVNSKTNQPIIITTPDELYETESQLIGLLNEMHLTFTLLMEGIESELQNAVENGEISAAICDELPKSFKTTNEFFQVVKAHYSFLNYHILDSLAPLLSDPLAQRAKRYCSELEGTKKEAKITALHNPLEEYFQTQSAESVKVTMALQNAWRTCSMWFVEQLLQSIFSSAHLGMFQWFRIDNTESVGVTFLVPENITTRLIENSTMKIELMRLTGVTSLQIGEFHVYQEGINHKDMYSFKEGVAQAKSSGDKEALHLLSQINQAPRATLCPTTRDDNNNFHIYPDPDSTALMIACCNDNTEMVELLLNNNADPNVQNGRKYTALIYATRNSKIFQMLLDHNADINIVNLFNETVLFWACIVGNLKLVKTLLENNRELMDVKHTRGMTGLYMAYCWGHIQVVELFLQAQTDPNIQNNIGRTTLHIASYSGHRQIVQRLLQAQADPNIRDNDGATPLRFASQEGKLEVVELLLQAQADPNIPSNNRNTPLHIASYNGHQQVVQRLLQAKANPYIRDDVGATPLHVASQEGKLAIVELLLQAQADPDVPLNNGSTPLHIASYNGHQQVVQRLLQAKVDINIQQNDGGTPLHVASQEGKLDMVELLLQAKADPNVPLNDGSTPLHIASYNGHQQVVQRLLQAQADPNIRADDGRTPLDVAIDNDHSQVVEILLQALTNSI